MNLNKGEELRIKPLFALEYHYGTYVWTNQEMDRLRQEQCLCLNCEIMGSCPSAKKIYQICVDNDMAMMITRCKSYKIK